MRCTPSEYNYVDGGFVLVGFKEAERKA